MTIETNRMISNKVTKQISRKLNEIKSSLNLQIQDANSTVTFEKVLPPFKRHLTHWGGSVLARWTGCVVSDIGAPQSEVPKKFSFKKSKTHV